MPGGLSQSRPRRLTRPRLSASPPRNRATGRNHAARTANGAGCAAARGARGHADRAGSDSGPAGTTRRSGSSRWPASDRPSRRPEAAAQTMRNRQRHEIAGEVDDVLQVIGLADACPHEDRHAVTVAGGKPHRPADAGVEMAILRKRHMAHAMAQVGLDQVSPSPTGGTGSPHCRFPRPSRMGEVGGHAIISFVAVNFNSGWSRTIRSMSHWRRVR